MVGINQSDKQSLSAFQKEDLHNLSPFTAFFIFGLNTLEIVNKGNVDIYHLELKMIDGEGNSEISKFKYNVDSGASVSGDISLKMSDGTRPKEIIIYPALVGSVSGENTNKVFTCLEYGKVIKL